MGGSNAGSLVLGPMLRHVGATSATIWVETAHPATVTVLGTSTPTFTRAGPSLRPGDRRGARAGLDRRVRRARRRAARLARARQRPAAEHHQDGRRHRRRPVRSDRAAPLRPTSPRTCSELAVDERGRGVDTLWAHAARMTTEPVESWPTAAVLVGDQIYADDSSPRAKERIERAPRPRQRPPGEHRGELRGVLLALPARPGRRRLERWLFSVVPSVMIFDDHDMIDDWNISVVLGRARSGAEPWWRRPRHRRPDDLLGLPAPREHLAGRDRARRGSWSSSWRSTTAPSSSRRGRVHVDVRRTGRLPLQLRPRHRRREGRRRSTAGDGRVLDGEPAHGRRRRVGSG